MAWSRCDEVLPLCEELGIGFVPLSPLGYGFLTGTITQDAALRRPRARLPRLVPRIAEDALAANMALVDVVRHGRGTQGAYTRPDGAGLAAGAEAFHRADPRYNEGRPPRREHAARCHHLYRDGLHQLDAAVAAVKIEALGFLPGSRELTRVEAPPKT